MKTIFIIIILSLRTQIIYEMPEVTIENQIKYLLYEYELIERISDIKLEMDELMIEVLTRRNSHLIIYDGIVKGILKYTIRNYRMCDRVDFDELRMRTWNTDNTDFIEYEFNSDDYLMVINWE